MVAGLSPVYILAIIITVTMALTNVINNAAAAIVMAPVAVEIAKQLKVSPDSLLMAVAVAASAAFITPIAHQSNALVMKPGGYEFKDYFFLGAPLTIFFLLLALPCLLIVWPL
jgi:di/tricarboxylate transporter